MRAMNVRTLTAALAVTIGLAACGDDDEQGAAAPTAPVTTAPAGPTTLALAVGGTTSKPTITAPESVPAGLTRIELTSRSEYSAQLVRFDAGHRADEAVAAVSAWTQGSPLPAWVHLEGGVSATRDRPAVAVQVLPPGSYVAGQFGQDGAPKAQPTVEFAVTGDGAARALASPAGTVAMKDYAFTATGLKPGRQQVRVDNVGKEPHFVLGVPLEPGATLAEARRFFETEGERSGPPPVDFENGFDTGVLDGGGEQVVDLDLQRGAYVFICFVPDRAGGPPHVAKGMTAKIDVG